MNIVMRSSNCLHVNKYKSINNYQVLNGNYMSAVQTKMVYLCLN